MTPPVIRIQDLWLWWPDTPTPTLAGLHWHLEGPGVAVVTGSAGSGKSTLLLVLAGLVPHPFPAQWQGTAQVGSAHPLAGDLPPVSLLLQHPETQLAAYGWAQEVLRDLPWEPEPVPLHQHSSGELQLLALKRVLSTAQPVVLLDEPFANLDARAAEYLSRWIETHRQTRRIVLVTHSLPPGLIPDSCFLMQEGTLRSVSLAHLKRTGQLRIAEAVDPPRLSFPSDGSCALSLEALRLTRGTRTLVTDGRLCLRQGELALLTGANGSGKTTLVRWLLGLEPGQGRLRWNGRRVRNLRGRALLVPEQPERLFWGATLQETLRTLGGARVELAPPLPEALWHRPAVLLSGGQAQIGALALAFALAPPLLILDEPTHALDARCLAYLQHWLQNYRAQGGMALVITHHPQLFRRQADRWYHIQEARLGEVLT